MQEQQKFLEIVCSVLNEEPGSITMDSRLTEDLGADSLQIYRIMTEAGEVFDLSPEDQDGIYGETPGDLFAFFQRGEV